MCKERLPYLTADEIRNERQDMLRDAFARYEGDASTQLGAPLLKKYTRLFSTPTERILDMGVAGGRFTEILFREGCRNIYGVDIDDYRKEAIKAKKMLVDFVRADLSRDKLAFDNSFFDVATAWCVLPHLENPHHCIREVHRVLRKGGIWIISMPHITSLRMRKIFLKTGNLDRYTKENNHISIFTPDVFTNTVLRYFDLVATEYYIHPGVFAGRFGFLKRYGVEHMWFGQDTFRRWFGTNIIYILRRK